MVLRSKHKLQQLQVEGFENNKKEKEQLIEEEIYEVLLDLDDGSKVTNIRVALKGELRGELIECLKNNKDCFKWSQSNMGGIDPKGITHQLNVNPSF